MSGSPLDYESKKDVRVTSARRPADVAAFAVSVAAWVALFLVHLHAAIEGDPIVNFNDFRAYHAVVALAGLSVLGTSALSLRCAWRDPTFWPWFAVLAVHAIVFCAAALSLIRDIRADAFPLNTNWPFS